MTTYDILKNILIRVTNEKKVNTIESSNVTQFATGKLFGGVQET